ncbi:unnamed protein product, partial [marine sediment metagenome]
GTGAFRFQELVLGSHMRLDRNPNYWDTMTIDGVEYELPFLDEVMCVIIKDAATALAALQTGKLDFGGYAPPYWDTLRATQLEYVLFPSAVCAMAVLKVTQPPFDNLDVRRALRIGTDMKAFGTLIGGAQPINFYPFLEGTPACTPMAEKPASTQELYQYDPVKAAQMLRDAGIPDGFKMKYYTSNTTAWLDSAALLADQWAKLGIELEIISEEVVTWRTRSGDRTYTDSLSEGADVGNPLDSLCRKGESGNYFNYSG